MKKAKIVSLLLVLVLIVGIFAACGADPAPAPSTPSTPDAGTTPAPDAGKDVVAAPSDTVKIGIVNPTTGPLAGFGEGCPWTEELIVDYVNNELGGIYFEAYDATLPIEIIVYDSQSDTTVCSEMAQKLVEEDGVHMLIARHTPDTVNPVNAIAERYGVFCVSIECPVDAWAAEGDHDYAMHSQWCLDDIVATFKNLWAGMGYPEAPENKVGFVFPNDSDGTAWANKFSAALAETDYTVVDPGRFPTTTTDYSDIIKTFKDEGVQIVVGCVTCPVFGAFWLQCGQMGYEPPVVGVGKAYLLEADALAIGAELMDGLLTEIWWSAGHPYTSSLTGWNGRDLEAAYNEATGRPITQPIGYKYASMEICVALLQAATSLDTDELLEVRKTISIDTIIGNVTYDQTWPDNNSQFALTPVCGGQWQLQEDGSLELVILDNALYPEIEITGEYKDRV